MIDLTPTYWPFDVLGPLERTPLHNEMLRFFNATYDAGFKPFVTNNHSEIGFGAPREQDARFVLRGGRGKHWEPWLSDSNGAIRLGPIWGLPESTCMVFTEFDDITTFCLRWLGGDSLDTSLAGVPVYSKHDTNTPLYYTGPDKKDVG
jgi:hypothetical protein